jgi:hypothetical protein
MGYRQENFQYSGLTGRPTIHTQEVHNIRFFRRYRIKQTPARHEVFDLGIPIRNRGTDVGGSPVLESYPNRDSSEQL